MTSIDKGSLSGEFSRDTALSEIEATITKKYDDLVENLTKLNPSSSLFDLNIKLFGGNYADLLLALMSDKSKEYKILSNFKANLGSAITQGLDKEQIVALIAQFKKEVDSCAAVAGSAFKAERELETKEKAAKSEAAGVCFLLDDKKPTENDVYNVLTQYYIQPFDTPLLNDCIKKRFKDHLITSIEMAFKACKKAGVTDDNWKNIDLSSFIKILEVSGLKDAFKKEYTCEMLFHLILGNVQKERCSINLYEVAFVFAWLNCKSVYDFSSEDAIRICYYTYFFKEQSIRNPTPFLGVVPRQDGFKNKYSLRLGIKPFLLNQCNEMIRNIFIYRSNGKNETCLFMLDRSTNMITSAIPRGETTGERNFLQSVVDRHLDPAIRKYYYRFFPSVIPPEKHIAPPAPFPRLV